METALSNSQSTDNNAINGNRFNFNQPYYLHIDTDPEKLIDFLNNTILTEILFSEPLNKDNVQELKDMRLLVYQDAIYECDDPEILELMDNPSSGLSNPIPTFKLSSGLEEMNRYLDLASESEFLKKIPFEMRTYEKCLESIHKHIYNIADVPSQYKTRELCAETLKNFPKYCGDGLFHIIEHIPYPDMITTFANQHKHDVGYYCILKCVPPERIEKQLFCDAINTDIRCINYVTEGMQIEGIPKLTRQEIEDIKSVSDLCEGGRTYSELPVERKTEAVSHAAVACGSSLAYVPENILTEDFILKQIKTSFHILDEISKEKINRKMLDTALDCSGIALYFFPNSEITPGTAMKAVKDNGNAIAYVPEDILSKDLYRAALTEAIVERKTPFMYYCETKIMETVPYRDLCFEILKKIEDRKDDYYFVYASIDPKFKDEKSAWDAIRINPKCFREIPMDVMTSQLCTEAVKADWKNLDCVPLYLMTDKLCQDALKNNAWALKYIPDPYKTQDICLQAVISDPRTRDLVPGHILKTSNLYSFYQAVIDKSSIPQGKLDFETVKSMYQGKSVILEGIKVRDKMYERAIILYDKDKHSISIKPERIKEQDKVLENKTAAPKKSFKNQTKLKV